MDNVDVVIDEAEERFGDDQEQEAQENENQKSIGGRKNLVRKDLFELDADVGNRGNNRQAADWGTVVKLGFQCIGIVYGNLGTSPLYVLSSTFPDGINHKDDLLGVLSLIIYSVISITLIKYVFVVLAANDHGDGGTFALYSLMCRYAKINLIPNQQNEDKEVSNYKLDVPNCRMKRASAVKARLENSIVKYILLLLTMLGVSMVIGDGILTPSISVLSAVGGIKEAAGSLTDTTIMWISVVILIILFQIQRFGTDKVGYTFAPILLVWFGFITVVGIYNFFKYDPSVIKAFNPWYIVTYFQRNRKEAWISLGGVMLCLTGSEALYADLGHFNLPAVRISACTVLIPSILIAYFGQCSYLRVNKEDVVNVFYASIPKSIYWPQFVLAVFAAIIASQSLISASFAIIQQSVALGCFPRVKVVHTSEKYEGQVYIPEINTLLMVACVGVTFWFKNTLHLSHAYGIAVALVFVITSFFIVLVMLMIWKTHIVWIILYVLTIIVIELIFLSSLLYKFTDGGYLPLFIGLVLVVIMFIWNFGYRKKYLFELENKVSPELINDMASNPKIKRVQGVGLFYSQLVQGVSPIFTHYVSSVPALHSVLVFVSIKSLPISKVPPDERFLFQRVKADGLIFRCITRVGYKDGRKAQEALEEMLVNQLKEFILESSGEDAQRELALVDEALREGGVVYLMGEGEMLAAKGSGFVKRLVIDYLYNWLSRCVRQPDEIFLIPRKRLLKVGMPYEV